MHVPSPSWMMPNQYVRVIARVVTDNTRPISMAVNIHCVCQVVYFHIRCIVEIRKCLTTAACRIIAQALVMARVDYGYALLSLEWTTLVLTPALGVYL